MANKSKTRRQVSVIIPAFNCEDAIADAIERALETVPAVREVIVADQNSADETVSVALSVGDPRVKIISLGTCSPEDAVSAATREATGSSVVVWDLDRQSFEKAFA